LRLRDAAGARDRVGLRGSELLSVQPESRALFLLFSLLFFAPQYLYPTTEIGFTTHSVSHSFQYLFFMAVVAFNGSADSLRNRSQLPPNVWTTLLFGGLVLVGGAIITIRGEFGTLILKLTGSAALGNFVTGAMFGLVVAHYVIDAHAWRLREKLQRDFVLGRFNFLARPEGVEKRVLTKVGA